MKAIFLGKFQPPHLGHVRTILNVAKDYEQLIIGITKGTPKIIDYGEVYSILSEVLSTCNNIEVVLIDGMVEAGTASLSNFSFDIVVSGNHKVLDVLKKQGYKTRFWSRTEGLGYSGSEIRELSQSQNTIALEDKKQLYQFQLMKISELKPLERVLPHHLKNIEELILKDGMIKKPIIVDSKYNIVLDGSYRYAFLMRYGFKYAPVIRIHYDDESIFVGNHLRHRFLRDEKYIISKSEVISRAVNENLFDARTVRHFFPFRKTEHIATLTDLSKGEMRDISYLLQEISIEEEILQDMNYIAEINEELDILQAYIIEQEEVKNYLKFQIEKMKKL
ncbi:hypothetical protein [Acinetobacter sp. CFCC 10889]|uniref:hypothetical protein n=1 Tax=Acinetobacter sp. CFCC 10889 TaxID=1775557 RepID=UPI0013A6A603|nr:hypothetical protein [Acinetobacter sp. CFCC 10889]